MAPDLPASKSSATAVSAAAFGRIGNLTINFEGRETRGGVTVYAIRVTGPGGSYVVHRRYKDFATLHRDMFGEQVELTETQASRMPPKSFFRKMFSPKFRARRERGLSEVAIAALAAAANSDAECCPSALRAFLGLDGIAASNDPRNDPSASSSAEAAEVNQASSPDEAVADQSSPAECRITVDPSACGTSPWDKPGSSPQENRLPFWSGTARKPDKRLHTVDDTEEDTVKESIDEFREAIHAQQSQEHLGMPRTLSRHHSRQQISGSSRRRPSYRRCSSSPVHSTSRDTFDLEPEQSTSRHTFSLQPQSFGSSYNSPGAGSLQEPLLWRHHSLDLGQDLQQPMMEEEEHQEEETTEEYEEEEEEKDEAQGEQRVHIESTLVGSWMDVSVTKKYAETFTISQEQGSLEYMEVTHDGQVHRTTFQREDDNDDYMIAKSQAGSIRTYIRNLSPHLNLIKLDFEFKSHDEDVWTESFAGKVCSITKDAKTQQQFVFLPKVMALLIVVCLALMDSMFFMTVDPRKRNTFYEGYSWHPVQTSRGTCLMPPPQPFYLEVSGSMVQTFAVSTMMSIQSVVSWADEYPRKSNRLELVKAQGLRWYLNYQTVSLPLSLCLVGYHWMNSASEDFVCLGAMFVNAPYILNALVSCAQWALCRQYVRHMHTWSRGAKHRTERWRAGIGGFVERKQRWLGILTLTSAVLIGIPALVVFTCYCLPGLSQPILLFQFLIILSSGAMISWLLGAVEFWRLATGEAVKGELLKRTQFLSLRWEIMASGNSYASKEQMEEATRVSEELAEAAAKQKEIARFGWTYAVFYFMPFFLSIRVALEVLFCEITYMNSGLTAWEATEVTWSERRLNVFMLSLILTSHMIVWHLWSSFQLLLEWL